MKNRKLSDERLESASFGCLKSYIVLSNTCPLTHIHIDIDKLSHHLSIGINVICYCWSLIIVLPSVSIELFIYISLACSLLHIDWAHLCQLLAAAICYTHFTAFDLVNLHWCRCRCQYWCARRNEKL